MSAHYISREARRHADRLLAVARRKGKTMKVDLGFPIRDTDGTDIKDKMGAQDVANALVGAGMKASMVEHTVNGLIQFMEEPETTTFLTAKKVCVTALGSPDKDATGAKIIDRIGLAIRINETQGEVEVSEEQVRDIMARVKEIYLRPVVYFRLDLAFKEASVKKTPAVPD